MFMCMSIVLILHLDIKIHVHQSVFLTSNISKSYILHDYARESQYCAALEAGTHSGSSDPGPAGGTTWSRPSQAASAVSGPCLRQHLALASGVNSLHRSHHPWPARTCRPLTCNVGLTKISGCLGLVNSKITSPGQRLFCRAHLHCAGRDTMKDERVFLNTTIE